jgi:hypothetical protein
MTNRALLSLFSLISFEITCVFARIAAWLGDNNRGLATAAAPAGHLASVEHGLEAWINLRVIQKLTHHTTEVIVAVLLFSLVGFIVKRLMHDSLVKRAVLLIDELVLFCLFVYFAYELIIFLYRALPSA